MPDGLTHVTAAETEIPIFPASAIFVFTAFSLKSDKTFSSLSRPSFPEKNLCPNCPVKETPSRRSSSVLSFQILRRLLSQARR